MFCKNCGKENKESTAFCTGCGSPLEGAPENPENRPASKNVHAPVIKQPANLSTRIKSSKGLFIGLIAANAVLIAAVVVLVVVLTADAPVEGFWFSESEGDVIAFTDDGKVDLYEINGKISGSYEYKNGTGEFSILDSNFDFKVNGVIMEIDGEYEYQRVLDKDFAIFAFVDKYTVESKDNINLIENTPVPVQTEPPQVTQPPVEPTPVLTPIPTQVPETPVPDDPTVSPKQNIDKELAEKIVLNTWYGHYKYSNDGTEDNKSESDYYEFYEDGTFIYQYAGDGNRLYGPWEIHNGQLTVFYENSEIGEVTWDIVISTVDGHSVLYFFDIRLGYEGGYWIYADIPV